MTDHPLTTEMMRKIHGDRPGYSNPFDEDDMRAAWDLAVERMSQWIEENGHEYVTYDYELGCQSNFSQMIADFKKAMRPQEDNL